jgi:ubiquinone/menaquinone biosynthesis C-methylase UbiE
MREKETVSDGAVKQANRILYDAVASNYEAVDGRRSAGVESWIKARLAAFRRQAPGGAMLDIGTGGGFIPRCAKGIFETRAGIDISPLILAANKDSFDFCAAADVDNLPFRDGSFDFASCFAVLHHLPSHTGLAAGLRRVLRPGGIFYSDHDMDAAFYNRFRIPLFFYRRLRNAKAKYRGASSVITDEIYERTEIHESGIDSAALVKSLSENGFSVTVTYHWRGLNPLCDKIFGERAFSSGLAPLASVTAVRQ